MTLRHARSPSSNHRRRLLPPAPVHHIQQAHNRQTTMPTRSNTMSPLASLSDLSDALETPSSEHDKAAKGKGVRFSSKVSVVEIPPPDQPKARSVSFSDEIIDIDTAEPTHPSPSPSPPKKRVRFGCLKTSMRKHLSYTAIYKMKSVDAINPLMKPKKRVRFGCMKCDHPPTLTHSNAEVVELLADEAAAFKREKRRGSTSTDEMDASEQTIDSEGMHLD